MLGHFGKHFINSKRSTRLLLSRDIYCRCKWRNRINIIRCKLHWYIWHLIRLIELLWSRDCKRLSWNILKRWWHCYRLLTRHVNHRFWHRDWGSRNVSWSLLWHLLLLSLLFGLLWILLILAYFLLLISTGSLLIDLVSLLTFNSYFLPFIIVRIFYLFNNLFWFYFLFNFLFCFLLSQLLFWIN